MRHIVITRCTFTDNNLFQKYLKVMKEIYFPCFSAQTCKNFDICIIVDRQHKEIIQEEAKKFQLNVDIFAPTTPKQHYEFIQDIKELQYTIQTRHDCDDWASPDYIEIIQNTYLKNKELYDEFLIQADPLKLNFDTKLEYNPYFEKFSIENPSMFLSLCQKNCSKYIYQEQHQLFSKIVPNVINIGRGYVKWVIHGNNKLGMISKLDTLA